MSPLPYRNPLLAAQNRVAGVTIEYTRNGKRVTKEFTGAGAVGASRRFYAAKLRDGAEPKVVAANRNHP